MARFNGRQKAVTIGKYIFFAENEFFGIFEEEGNYFLADKELRNSCLIVNSEDLRHAI